MHERLQGVVASTHVRLVHREDLLVFDDQNFGIMHVFGHYSGSDPVAGSSTRAIVPDSDRSSIVPRSCRTMPCTNIKPKDDVC